MKWETFKKIAPSFSSLEYVHLQGWGEPLLHPNLLDMLEKVKESETEVGFTTNGMQLTEDRCRDLVEIGVDRIGVSLDGATQETYQAIRSGGDFQRVVSNLETLEALKEGRSSDKPQIIILFIKMTKNIEELPSLVKLGSNLEVDKVVATNLDCVNKSLDEKFRVFSRQGNEYYQGIVNRAQSLARTEGIPFHSYPLSPREVGECSAEPLTTTYVSWEGYVGPCVNLNLPVNIIDRLFWGDKYQINPLRFGKITEESLTDIWNSDRYREFRSYFERRCRDFDVPSIDNPFSLLDPATEQKSREVSPLPPSCRTCYKQYDL